MGEAKNPGPPGRLARAMSIKVFSAVYRLDSLTGRLGDVGLCVAQEVKLFPTHRHLGAHLLMGPVAADDGKCLLAADGVGGAFEKSTSCAPGGCGGECNM